MFIIDLADQFLVTRVLSLWLDFIPLVSSSKVFGYLRRKEKAVVNWHNNVYYTISLMVKILGFEEFKKSPICNW